MENKWKWSSSQRRVIMFMTGVALFLMALSGEPTSSNQRRPRPRRTLKKKPNILFLVSDDLRLSVGNFMSHSGMRSHAHPKIHTPNLDALAKRSVAFDRAHVQGMSCGPSRSAFLTSRHLDTTGAYHTQSCFRKLRKAKNMVTLPQYFKMNGYKTYSVGKIYHNGCGGDKPSWTKEHIPLDPYLNKSAKYPWAARALTEEEESRVKCVDTNIADKAIEILGGHVGPEPLFLAVGFRKPHMPFTSPERFWKLYPEDDRSFHPEKGENVPTMAYRKDSVDAWQRQKESAFRRGYFAAVSHMDDELGRVVNALDKSKLEEETVVVFMSDHGYMLGEFESWNKRFLFRLVTQIPLTIRIPRVTDMGWRVNRVVQSLDLFPTLADLAGLKPLPECPKDDPGSLDLCTQGRSLLPLLENNYIQPGPSYAYSQLIRYKNGLLYNGKAVISDRYRYTEWPLCDNNTNTDILPCEDLDGNVELYDYETDPDETVNVAGREENKEIIEELKARMREGGAFRDVDAENVLDDVKEFDSAGWTKPRH